MKNHLIILIILVLLTKLGLSQQDTVMPDKSYKHFIGIQINPYPMLIKGFSWDEIHAYAYAMRYGYQLNMNYSLGAELSGYQIDSYQYLYKNSQSKMYQAGLFGRYTYSGVKTFNPYAEFSLYYAYSTSWSQLRLESPRISSTNHNISGYIALGTSWRLFTDRLSLDVMYKFTNQNFVNGRKHVMSYRLNFHF